MMLVIFVTMKFLKYVHTDRGHIENLMEKINTYFFKMASLIKTKCKSK